MDELEILVFQIESNYYGIRLDQVQAMRAEQAIAGPCESVHEILGYSSMIAYNNPHAVSISAGSGRMIRIGGVVGIFHVRRKEIRSIPDLMRHNLKSPLIWGAVQCWTGHLRGHLVFLLDFHRQEAVA